MTRRDDLRKRDPTSSELPRLNKDIQKRICEHTRKKCRDLAENMDKKTDLTKLWRSIKGIDGRELSYYLQRNLVLIIQAASRQVQQTIQHFKARQTLFFKRNPISSKAKRKPMEMAETFTVDIVTIAIKSCRNSKAFGHDKLSISTWKISHLERLSISPPSSTSMSPIVRSRLYGSLH